MARGRFMMYGCDPDESVVVDRAAARLGLHVTTLDAPVSEDNAASARGHRCVSVDHTTPVSKRVLGALGRVGVEFISTRSIGVDHIDLAAADALGMRVENVAYPPDGVADYSVMLILMAVRSMKRTLQQVELHDYRLDGVRGRELCDLTVGVVGTGRIGTAVIDRLRGFGCRILAFDTRPAPDVDRVPLDDLLRHSDVISLHLPLNAQTHHLIGASQMEQMKRGAMVVNTGRGSLVDTEALVEALEAGRLGGAALDVIEGEEGVFYADQRGTALEHELLARLQRLPNAIISPHAAYDTDRALNDRVEQSLLSCVRFESELLHA